VREICDEKSSLPLSQSLPPAKWSGRTPLQSRVGLTACGEIQSVRLRAWLAVAVAVAVAGVRRDGSQGSDDSLRPKRGKRNAQTSFPESSA